MCTRKTCRSRFVFYSQYQPNELKRVIERSELDVSSLESSELTEAIFKSFSNGVTTQLSPRYTLLVSEKSRCCLQTELGLNIEDEDPVLIRLKALKCIKPIVDRLEGGDAEHYLSVIDDCYHWE
jgi:hypothetical protein